MTGSALNGAADVSQKYTVVASAKRTSKSQEVGSSSSSSQGAQENAKRVKGNIFPLFTRKINTDAMEGGKGSRSSLTWHTSLGKHRSCLKATCYEPFKRQIEERRKGDSKEKAKIACFDLDGCLIRPKNGKSFPSNTDEYDFEEAFRGTFDKVKQEYESGSCVVIVSNQKQSTLTAEPSKKLRTWKAKMQVIAQAIDCPMLILAALSDDGFRKPGRLMWDHAIVPAYIEAGGESEDISIYGDVKEQVSFFVGDAAGRIADHSDTDRKWAMNVGIPFYTPEEYFKGEKPLAYKLKGYKPTMDIANGTSEPLPSDFFPLNPTRLELIVFVGPPAAGKTTLYKNHFQGRGFEWVNQDTLKTASKCLAAARQHLINHCSVVIDNTNRNKSIRSTYIALAKELDVNIRCVYFDASQELCVHNNYYRVRAGLQRANEERTILPYLALSSYFDNVELPTRDEGFDAEVVTVKWSFRGDEESRRRWLMFWQ